LILCFTDKTSLEPKGFQQFGLRLYEEAEIRGLLDAFFSDIRVEPHKDEHRRFYLLTASAR
jgi:hypothetical protein